jgi:glutathione peroxidase
MGFKVIGISVLIAFAISVVCGCEAKTANQDEKSSINTETEQQVEDGQMSMSNPEQAYVLHHAVEMIDGEQVSLEQYKGKVLLIVNVASECGYTRQYEGLEALYRKYKDQGLVIIGFPANDFGKQEPGTNDEIAAFCSSKFDVTFPLAGKIHVRGEGTHPLFNQLSEQPLPLGGEPQWNFTKFLIARDGQVVDRFDTKTEPNDPGILSAIEEHLANG